MTISRGRRGVGIAAWVAVAVAAALTATDCRSGGPRRANAADVKVAGEVVTFPSGQRTLHGVLHRPAGGGPFPALLYNHGSAPGMEPAQAANALVTAKRMFARVLKSVVVEYTEGAAADQEIADLRAILAGAHR